MNEFDVMYEGNNLLNKNRDMYIEVTINIFFHFLRDNNNSNHNYISRKFPNPVFFLLLCGLFFNGTK